MTKIGIFDSGIGGLTIAASIQALMPNNDIVYIADSAYAPYGDKPRSVINGRCQQLTEKLIRLGCDVIVVACNTATVNTISQLRSQYKVSFVGIEPGIKPAVEQSPTQRIGVMVTQRTADSDNFRTFTRQFSKQARVDVQACPGLVEHIEAMDLDSKACQALIQQYLSKLIDNRVDTIVLGCTHYPFLVKQIKAILPRYISIIDTSTAVAQQVSRVSHSAAKVTVQQTDGTLLNSQTNSHQLITGIWIGTTGDNQQQLRQAADKLKLKVAGFERLT